MVQLWFSFVQLWFRWLSPDVIWLHFGSDVVQLCAWHDCVWLSFGSDVGGLSSDGAAVVPELVQIGVWFGSVVVQIVVP